MKNVIIRNSDIVYSGEPALLENVYFVNCTFKRSFKMTPNGRALGIKVLSCSVRKLRFEERCRRVVAPSRKPCYPITPIAIPPV